MLFAVLSFRGLRGAGLGRSKATEGLAGSADSRGHSTGENSYPRAFRDLRKGRRPAARFQMNVQRFISSRSSFGRQLKRLRSFALNTRHVIGAEQVERIDPTFHTVTRANSYKAAMHVDNTNPFAMPQNGNSAILLIQLSAEVYAGWANVSLGERVPRLTAAAEQKTEQELTE